MKLLLSLFLVLGLTACLKTRSEISGGSSSLRTDSTGRYVSGQVDQQQRAQIDSRFFEIDRDFRQLYGKIETLEKQVSDLSNKNQTAATEESPVDNKKLESLEKRMTTLEEALLAIDKKLSQLTGTKSSQLKSQKPKGPFGLGEMYFAQGKFEEAITSYDEYRKKYPRGKRYAQATLKMGICFQKLKMPQDAKAFYQEVIQRYPKTKVAKSAAQNLKSI